MRGGMLRRALLAVSTCALVWTSAAAAQDQNGTDPNRDLSLVEVNVPNKGAALRLQLEAESYGVEFNEHYLRHNRDGSATVSVLADEEGLDRLDAAGYEIARTIEGPTTWEKRAEQREAGIKQERRADAAALDEPVTITSHEDEIVILRADYFENYTGRYLSVEAKTRDASVNPTSGAYTGPA